MKKIVNGFLSLSTGLKILVIFTAIIAIAGICTATNIILNKDEAVLTVSQAQQEKNKIPEDIVGEVKEEVILIAEEPEEKKPEEKKVTYKGKEITIPEEKVAPAGSKEDGQSQKTGGEQLSVSEIKDKYENEGQSIGIDVSKWQGKINWAAVKASGIEFAIIRCGYRGMTKGDIFIDEYFKTNIKGAISNGIKVGVYFFSTAINEEEAIQEAAWTVNLIKSYSITYPVVYDFETFSGDYRCSGISGAQATSNAIAFLQYVKSAGYTPMMYANPSFMANKFDRSRLSSYKMWIAHYDVAKPNYSGPYHMWQHTSRGIVNGINGPVDMNIAYFTYDSVAKPKHTCVFEGGEIIKTVKPTCTEKGSQTVRCKDAHCSEEKVIDLKALGHDWGDDEDWIIEKEPTETEVGSKYRICKVCEEKSKSVEIPIITNEDNDNKEDDEIGNDEGSGTENDGVTDGKEDEKCSHDYKIQKIDSTCTEKGSSWEECTICGDKKNELPIEKLEHDFSENVVIDGISYNKCKNCEEKIKVEPDLPVATK